MWRQFRLLTSYQDESDDGVLPLMEESNTSIFEPSPARGLADGEIDCFLNRPLDIRETEAAIQSLKTNKAPGPDEIYTNLLNGGGDELVKAIHYLIHKAW